MKSVVEAYIMTSQHISSALKATLVQFTLQKT
jgi:hypothetical protein